VTSPLTAAGFESPSLGSPQGAGPAYELKFLLDETRAREIDDWAQARLVLDPHGDPALGGAYRTTSLYCDTPHLDVYHRSPRYRRRKFRVRRYGSMPWLFLERKSKSGDRVAKRRTAVPEEELTQLAVPMSLVDWPGHWFHRGLLARRLGPACRIVYQRTAYAGASSGSPLRLTLDRRLHGVLASGWSLDPVEGGLPLLTGQVILELKFRVVLPAPFGELMEGLRLRPSVVSKYRLCREAWGVSPASHDVGRVVPG
jgi:VTC domain